MRRVLFVDDEDNVLQGLRRMLRDMRRDWVMEFAASGEEGLRALEASHFDVVVSDMRMPGMDGAALLGVLGALIAIPIAASILLIVQEVVIPRQQRH